MSTIQKNKEACESANNELIEVNTHLTDLNDLDQNGDSDQFEYDAYVQGDNDHGGDLDSVEQEQVDQQVNIIFY